MSDGKKNIDKFPPIGKKTTQTFSKKEILNMNKTSCVDSNVDINVSGTSKEITNPVTTPAYNMDMFLTGMQENFKHLTTTLVEVIQQQQNTVNVNKRGADTAIISTSPDAKRHKITESATISTSVQSDRRSDSDDDDISIRADDESSTIGLTNHIDSNESSDDDKENVMDIIKQDLDTDEKKGPNIEPKLAEILQDIWNKPMAEDKLKNKLEKYKVPQNCNFLKTKRCNPEIWSIKLSEQQRSNDLKIQKIQNKYSSKKCYSNDHFNWKVVILA